MIATVCYGLPPACHLALTSPDTRGSGPTRTVASNCSDATTDESQHETDSAGAAGGRNHRRDDGERRRLGKKQDHEAAD
jgi:hypothetical protein